MVCPKNYSIYRKDRVRIGGGVAIYCRNDVKSAIVSITQTDKDIDIICVDLIFGSSKLRLITCYRPPSYSLDDYIYLESMISIISNLCESVPQFVIVGDFNLPKIDWVNYVSPIEKCHILFLTLVNNLGMYQYVLEPTRENNILDLPETNSESFYDFKNTDIIAFNSYLSKISWDFDFSFVFTTEEYWNIFSNHLRKGIDRFVPIRTIYHNKKSRSYPKYIYKMLIRKSFLWKRWSITKTTLHKKAFIQYASKCKKAISTHHKNVELKLVKENNLNDGILPKINTFVSEHIKMNPTLFLLFINDLPSIVKDLNCSLMLYADDIKLYCSFKDADYSHDLAVAIYKVYLWSKKWQLKIANNKCFTHRIAPTSFCKDINYNYQLGDHNLTWSTNLKDLGVTMDSYLNYSNHISNIVRVSNIRGYLILNCFKSRDPRVIVKAYTTYIRPILEYCSPVWSPNRTKMNNTVERVQRRFTKRISNLNNVSYSSRLSILGLELLEIQRLKQDMITCYEILKNLVCLNKSREDLRKNC
ncbi:uncharacterized protein LOC124806303 [Hydra vulgaris]|uniref:uncharacterized protein LOC124806303 n=1 Tax=Hydra vulgaris TaxID=6087 RepID=UPI001F5EAC98|nr:uncharacterized protein LOC124806303 [Hydra vulgaris]